jgi:hypothetical protein
MISVFSPGKSFCGSCGPANGESLGAGCWELGAGGWGAGSWELGAGGWELGAGSWVLGAVTGDVTTTQWSQRRE